MIDPAETLISDNWVHKNGKSVPESGKYRVGALTRDWLRFLGADVSGFRKLYIDPHDGRYWCLESERPTKGDRLFLRCLSRDSALEQFPNLFCEHQGPENGTGPQSNGRFNSGSEKRDRAENGTGPFN